ncbi:DUF3373 family protein [Nitrosophilus labii]|uniref:DUF3373 family protein n=1 Tax=Nitrosophilus labii TaxID=2706014 RepID=UPI001656B43B|nr:DUF3373 family protein [Nitrosophilus labii]
MKKFIAISAVAAMVSAGFASDADIKAELEALKKEIQALKEAQAKINVKSLKRQISEIKAKTGGDNLKWSVDFRTAYDAIGYETINGNSSWNQILTNRLWLGMAYAPKDNVVFKGLLSYYKVYGQSVDTTMNFNYFDWIVNETPNISGELRVKEAYWLYFGDSFLGADIPWTASFGRRPATDGLLVSYREDQNPKSPLGHIINTEFDGASFKFNLENVTDISGMYLKLCMGRGMTNATTRYSSDPAINYTKINNWQNTDLFGFIFVPYDDGQYSIHTTAFKAWNLPGYYATQYGFDTTLNTYLPNPTSMRLEQGADYVGAAISLLAQGIGDGINDTLDDTNAFISFAWSKTQPYGSHSATFLGGPYNGVTMNVDNAALGSTDSETGTSIYLGANWPCILISDARLGVEYNHGTKYWRSFTYAEDTLAGSKLATRGDAYEVWLTKELIGKTLTAQIRYTYIDYKYTGSQAFFGEAGTPIEVDSAAGRYFDALDKAQDIRFYIRYRY